MTEHFLKLDYAKLHLYCDTIIDELKKLEFEPTHVVGISRGGLVPGVILSHKYNIPFLPVVWSTRDFAQSDYYGLLSLSTLLSNHTNSNVLLVDDICDTGLTLKSVFLMLNSMPQLDYKNRLKTATIYKKQTASFKVDAYADIVADETWVVFPYEVPPHE